MVGRVQASIVKHFLLRVFLSLTVCSLTWERQAVVDIMYLPMGISEKCKLLVLTVKLLEASRGLF